MENSTYTPAEEEKGLVDIFLGGAQGGWVASLPLGSVQHCLSLPITARSEKLGNRQKKKCFIIVSMFLFIDIHEVYIFYGIKTIKISKKTLRVLLRVKRKAV